MTERPDAEPAVDEYPFEVVTDDSGELKIVWEDGRAPEPGPLTLQPDENGPDPQVVDEIAAGIARLREQRVAELREAELTRLRERFRRD